MFFSIRKVSVIVKTLSFSQNPNKTRLITYIIHIHFGYITNIESCSGGGGGGGGGGTVHLQ